MRRALAGMLLLLSVLTLFAVVGLIAGCGGNGGKPNTAPDKPFVYPTVTAALSRGSDFPYGAIKYEETPGRKMIVFAIRSDWKGGMADNRFLGYVHGDVRRYLGNSYKSEYGPVKRDTIMGDYITLTCTTVKNADPDIRPAAQVAIATHDASQIERMSAKEAFAYFDTRMSYYEDQAKAQGVYVGYDNLADGAIPALQHAVDLGGDPVVTNLCLDRLEKYVNHADSYDRVVDTSSHAAIKEMRSQMAKRAKK